jgi:hypothetical protein
MISSSSQSPARNLLTLLTLPDGDPPPDDSMAHTAMDDFITHLVAVQNMQRKKLHSERYLIEQVFSRGRSFKTDNERTIYCHCHLEVAIQQLKSLIDNIKDKATGKLSATSFLAFRHFFVDYVLDLCEIVPFLQRKVPNYVYLNAAKNSDVHSWEIYTMAMDLVYHAKIQDTGGKLNHKLAQIAAISVLRQAFELRFTRLISVYPCDRKGKSPRLRHDFHLNFIISNPQFFRPSGFNIAELRPLYEWFSEIVHQAYQPYAWQTGWAVQLSARLLKPHPASLGDTWSIANSVEVIDVQKMQEEYESHFLKNYDHGEWQMNRLNPEALVHDWDNRIASTALNYRPVYNRKKRFMAVRKFFSSIFAQIRQLFSRP